MVNQFTCLCQPHVLSQNHTQHSSFLVLTNLGQQDLEVLRVAQICLQIFSKQTHALVLILRKTNTWISTMPGTSGLIPA